MVVTKRVIIMKLIMSLKVIHHLKQRRIKNCSKKVEKASIFTYLITFVPIVDKTRYTIRQEQGYACNLHQTWTKICKQSTSKAYMNLRSTFFSLDPDIFLNSTFSFGPNSWLFFFRSQNWNFRILHLFSLST